MGVLRPTLLRYKGKTRKVDAAKMAIINNKMEKAENDFNKTGAFPKVYMFIGAVCILIFGGPSVFMIYKN